MLRGALAPVLARVGQLPNFFHQNFPPSSFSTSLVNIVVIARFIKMISITWTSGTNCVTRVLDCVHEYVRIASFISFCVSYYMTRDVALSTKMDGLNDQMDDQSLATKKRCVQFYIVCKAVFSRSNLKILHLAEKFYTTSGCHGFDKYEVCQGQRTGQMDDQTTCQM